MDDKLEFNKVSFEGHDDWAYDYLKNVVHMSSDEMNRRGFRFYDEMYKRGFIRLVNDCSRLGYTYKPGHPPTPRKMKAIKDFAIEMGFKSIEDDKTGKMEDLSPQEPASETVQKDIKSNINIPPEKTRYDDKGNLKFNLLNLDNLKALREKASRSWSYWSKRGNDENVELSMDAFKRYDNEIKKRLKYINRPVREIRLEPPVDNVPIRETTDDEQRKAKEAYVKQYISMLNDDTVVVTVNKDPSYPPSDYIQVDGFVNGKNLFSSNSEDLNMWGFRMPSTKELMILPRGQYKLSDAKKLLHKSIKENVGEYKCKAWWMDPSGKLEKVYKYDHWKWANAYFIKRGIDTEQGSYKLKQKGWIRVTFNYYEDNTLHFDYAKLSQPNEKQMAELKSLAIELRATKLVDGNFDREISLLQENMTYDQLLKLTADTPRSPEDNTNRIDRSKTVAVRSLPVSVEDDGEQWNFRYKSSPQSTVTDEPFEGHITFLKGDVRRGDDAMKLECKVDCGCPDYMYKFAFNNHAQGAGDIGPDSENDAINRRPKPAYDIGEGLCKHLSALSKYLMTQVKTTKKQNIFEAVNEVAKQGPFNLTYYDD